ncbi:MAG: hypothetical protein B0A82_10115 [Alkalinema sp. CACIAM 70d]|nr:MAG: hypothetical protein B0A82_10115 [Alkalinema sp. CACIAM 70d]
MDRYALVIGIGQYDGMPSLSKPAWDAIALQKVLEAAGWRVKCLSDKVDGKTLEAALTEFLERQAVGQDALIYFTGHGFMVEESEDDRRGYLATSDCTIELEGDTIVSQRKGLSFSRLNGLIHRARLSSLVVLLDCCHGGLFVEDGLVKRSLKAEADQNFCWIAACRSFQQSYARRSEAHSLFTGALLEALAESQAENGEVTVLSVLRFVNAAFKQMQMQEPIYIGAGKDIPLIRYGQRMAEPTMIREENPYQGLLAFTPATKQFFFGRDRVVDDLVLKLKDANFVPVIGASGSGKSSVVRAGLVPRLEELGWRVLEPIVPGTDPNAVLQGTIAALDDPAKNTLLVVDQFEEVFTLCRDRSEQSKFIQALMNLKIRVVVTMRADFVEACLADAGLTQAIEQDAVYLGPLVGENLEAAIEKPAMTQGMTIQPKLLAQILQDVKAEENCLPLLEFALSELWERSLAPNNGGTEPNYELTLADYRKLGGVAGALNAHAEGIYKQLATQKREHWVQRVMLKLVRTGERTKDTRQRQRKVDILAMAKDDGEREAIESVITALVDGRLLVSDRVDGQDVIDLSHEALMISWQRFVGWRENGRQVRRIVDSVEDLLRAWNDSGKKRRYLLEGRLLKDARRLLKDAPADVVAAKSFIWKSLWWRWTQLISILLVPILVLGVPSEYFWREEAVMRDYVRIEQLGNGDPGERAAIINLLGGCWVEKYLPILPKYLRERGFGNCRSIINARLDQANFSNLDLSGASFFRASLNRADFMNANMSRTKFIGTNLSEASFIDANLSKARLDFANLSKADFHSTNLSGAELGSANLSQATLWYVDLSEAYLGSTNLNEVQFDNTNLSGANLERANMKNAKFQCSGLAIEHPRLGLAGEHHQAFHQCTTLKNIKWDRETNWQGIQGWETVENIPPALKQQLGLKDKKEDGREKTEEKKKPPR